jgi:hypothetical protein
LVIIGHKEVILNSTVVVLNLNESFWLIFSLLKINCHHVGKVGRGLGSAIDLESIHRNDAEEEEVSQE